MVKIQSWVGIAGIMAMLALSANAQTPPPLPGLPALGGSESSSAPPPLPDLVGGPSFDSSDEPAPDEDSVEDIAPLMPPSLPTVVEDEGEEEELATEAEVLDPLPVIQEDELTDTQGEEIDIPEFAPPPRPLALEPPLELESEPIGDAAEEFLQDSLKGLDELGKMANEISDGRVNVPPLAKIPPPPPPAPPLPDTAEEPVAGDGATEASPPVKSAQDELIDELFGGKGRRMDDDSSGRIVPGKKHAKSSSAKSGTGSKTAKTSDFGNYVLPTIQDKPMHNRHNRHLPTYFSQEGLDLNLIDVVQRGDLRGLNALLDYGSNPNVQNAQGQTPLIAAVLFNREPIVQRLFEAGADINQPDKNGNTPLMLTVMSGNVPMALRLIELGADPNLANARGLVPLHNAAYLGYTHLVEALVDSGARVDVTDERGDTPLFAAISGGHVGITRLLLAVGAEVNHRNMEGNTTLHIAAESGNGEVVQALLSGISRVDVKNAQGLTAEELALVRRQTAVVNILSNARKQMQPMAQTPGYWGQGAVPPFPARPMPQGQGIPGNVPPPPWKTDGQKLTSPPPPPRMMPQNDNVPPVPQQWGAVPPAPSPAYSEKPFRREAPSDLSSSPMGQSQNMQNRMPAPPPQRMIPPPPPPPPPPQAMDMAPPTPLPVPPHRPTTAMGMDSSERSRYEALLAGFIEADARFEQLNDSEKRYWNGQRKQLMLVFPEYFRADTATDQQLLRDYLARWEAVDRIRLAPKATEQPPAPRVDPEKMQRLQTMLAAWYRVDASFNRMNAEERKAADQQRLRLLEKLVPNKRNGEYAAEFAALPKNQRQQFLQSMQKWEAMLH